MPQDDDPDDDVGGLRPPLHPDDRLWRHPSELAGLRPVPAAPATTTVSDPRPHPWPVALVAGLVGAALSTGVLAATGALSTDVVEHPVVEKVAVTPIVSSPTIRGERGVAAVAEHLAPAVVRVVLTHPDGVTSGSGVVYRDDGLVLTSTRLIDGATSIDVVFADGRHLEARVLGADRMTDVAVVDVDADRLPVALLGSSTDLVVGSPTIAIGAPLIEGREPSVSTGVISGLHRRVDLGDGQLHGMIQIDAPVEVGGRGGALVDATGAVIGILGPATEGAATGFGYATPIDLARRVAAQLVASGEATHAWLGIEGADLTHAQARTMDLEGGAKVYAVQEGSPAAGAGLAEDDVITHVDGEPVSTASELVELMREHQPGDQVMVEYWRDGEVHEATVTVGQHP